MGGFVGRCSLGRGGGGSAGKEGGGCRSRGGSRLQKAGEGEREREREGERGREREMKIFGEGVGEGREFDDGANLRCSTARNCRAVVSYVCSTVTGSEGDRRSCND